MKDSTLFLVCIAFLMAMTALASSAYAVCSTCVQEGDWSQSASSFLEGKPLSDEPQEFGPRAVRRTTSQFENKSNDAQEAPDSNMGAAATAAANANASKVAINLTSINASPSSVNSGSPVKITAIFSVSSPMQSVNETEIANNASTSLDDEILLTASAAIKDSTGKDVGNVNLVKSAGNEYSGSWSAQVLPGIYNVNIFASSLQGSGTFNDVLQINVVASGNAATSTPAVKNLG